MSDYIVSHAKSSFNHSHKEPIYVISDCLCNLDNFLVFHNLKTISRYVSNPYSKFIWTTGQNSTCWKIKPNLPLNEIKIHEHHSSFWKSDLYLSTLALETITPKGYQKDRASSTFFKILTKAFLHESKPIEKMFSLLTKKKLHITKRREDGYVSSFLAWEVHPLKVQQKVLWAQVHAVSRIRYYVRNIPSSFNFPQCDEWLVVRNSLANQLCTLGLTLVINISN